MDPRRSHQPLPIALAALMAEKRLTVGQLWVAAGLESPSSIYHYLRGRRGRVFNAQSALVIRKIAPVLGVAPDYFREYRIYLVQRILAAFPELVDVHYDLLTSEARARGFEE